MNLDREQFERAVVNLVDNAAEAMQDSLVKKLYIATQPGAAETVELVVADSGCGVSPDEKEKLFLPYFSTKNRGTGLGLAIVSHIVAEHNGAHPGGGQPAGGRALHGGDPGAAWSPSRRDAAGGTLSRGQGMKQRRILVVDDEPGIRQSLSGVLEDEGYARGGRGKRRGVPGGASGRAISSWCCWISGCRAWTAWRCWRASRRFPSPSGPWWW